jgi:hypothetical protein
MQRSPSDPNERATSKPVFIPTVLAVGCTDALLSRCWDALSGMGVMVRDCEPSRAATLAAARQPLAIVVPTRIYALDPEELEALARDVRATLVRVEEDASGRALADTLTGAVRTAVRWREERSPSGRREGRSPSGRYSILPGELVAVASGAARSEPPPTSVVRSARPAPDEMEEELLAALR